MALRLAFAAVARRRSSLTAAASLRQPWAAAAVRSFADDAAATGEKSLHSSDIAFKPNQDGWGFTNRYAAGYDNIFSKNKQKQPAEPAADASAATPKVALTHNAYYDDMVQSLAFEEPGGPKTSVGVIAGGSYHFGTEAPERMTVVSGACEVQIDGTDEWVTHEQGSSFNIAGNHGFNIRVTGAAAAYLCEYL